MICCSQVKLVFWVFVSGSAKTQIKSSVSNNPRKSQPTMESTASKNINAASCTNALKKEKGRSPCVSSSRKQPQCLFLHVRQISTNTAGEDTVRVGGLSTPPESSHELTKQSVNDTIYSIPRYLELMSQFAAPLPSPFDTSGLESTRHLRHMFCVSV